MLLLSAKCPRLLATCSGQLLPFRHQPTDPSPLTGTKHSVDLFVAQSSRSVVLRDRFSLLYSSCGFQSVIHKFEGLKSGSWKNRNDTASQSINIGWHVCPGDRHSQVSRMTLTIALSHRKYITKFVGNTIKMLYIGLNYPELKIKDCNSGKRSHLRSSTLTLGQEECIHRVISQNGDRVLFEGLATPRPAPKVTLKSNWLVQQQQQPIRKEDVKTTRNSK